MFQQGHCGTQVSQTCHPCHWSEEEEPLKQRQPCIYEDGFQNLFAHPLLDYVSSMETWKVPSLIAMSGIRAEQSMSGSEKLSEWSVLKGSWLQLKDREEWKLMSVLLTWPVEGCCQWWQNCLMKAWTENKKLLRVLSICLVDSHTWPSYLLWILSHSKTYGSFFKLYGRRKRKAIIITGVLTGKEVWVVCVFPGLSDSCLFGVDEWIRWWLYLPW